MHFLINRDDCGEQAGVQIGIRDDLSRVFFSTASRRLARSIILLFRITAVVFTLLFVMYLTVFHKVIMITVRRTERADRTLTSHISRLSDEHKVCARV